MKTGLKLAGCEVTPAVVVVVVVVGENFADEVDGEEFVDDFATSSGRFSWPSSMTVTVFAVCVTMWLKNEGVVASTSPLPANGDGVVVWMKRIRNGGSVPPSLCDCESEVDAGNEVTNVDGFRVVVVVVVDVVVVVVVVVRAVVKRARISAFVNFCLVGSGT